MAKIQRKLGFDPGVRVDAIGRAGGVALLWSKDVDIRVRSTEGRFIDFEVKSVDGAFWRGTGMYGWPEFGEKWRSWKLIRDLGEASSMPWFLFGDFIEVLFEVEKQGGNECDFGSMTEFRGVIDSCGLKDLGFSGYKFTWSNRRGENFIEEWLDRAFANEEWLDFFPSFSIRHII